MSVMSVVVVRSRRSTTGLGGGNFLSWQPSGHGVRIMNKAQG